MALGGLGKPISRIGALAASSSKPYIKSNPRGVLCSSSRDDSPFVSSYDEDKRYKHRQQTKAKIMKWLLWLSFALVITAVVRSQSPTSDESALRGGAEKAEVVATQEVDPSDSASGGGGAEKAEVVVAQEVDPSDSASGGDVKPVIADPSVVLPSNKNNIEKGSENKICGTELSVNLADTSKWPTPFTPLLGNGKVPTDAIAQEVVLLKKDGTFGSLGAQLSSFFHAYDFAYDHGAPLYITKDSWVLDTLFDLFFGWEHEQLDTVYATLEKILRVKIVQDKAALEVVGIKVLAPPPIQTFYYKSTELDSIQVRDHRETILRQLFQYPAVKGDITKNVCSTRNSPWWQDRNDQRYTVIHLTDTGPTFLTKINQSTGKDHTAAAEMRPVYVINILDQMDMLKNIIFPIFSPGLKLADSEAFVRLSKDPTLGGYIEHDKEASHLGGYVYLAVLADVYLGSPHDPLCMWIARMRMALGFKNTYVLTEKQGKNWVSYVDSESHLEMYEAQKLGLSMG